MGWGFWYNNNCCYFFVVIYILILLEIFNKVKIGVIID